MDQAYATRLRRRMFEENGGAAPSWQLNTTAKVTAKINGKFLKVSMVRGDRFTLTECYVGKRGGLVFIFSHSDDPGRRHMEMTLDVARGLLKGFADYLAVIEEADLEGNSNVPPIDATANAAMADRVARNPLWASW
tara:strand:+ start:155 stop:562 length:408 start_codon:yes stop_codon:yes gene_type:complete